MRRILYHSTNKNVTEKSKGIKQSFTFKQALFMGLAPDNGLLMPSEIPRLSKKFIMGLKGKPYHKVAYDILKKFLSAEIKDNELSAIIEAFRGLNGIRVYILYPKNEVSSIQKRHMDTIRKNVTTISIEGKFDDCQNMVKKAFADPDLKKLNLTSGNSISIGRILPQIVYYFYAYANVVDNFKPVVFSIP